jgi:hypothetical protein
LSGGLSHSAVEVGVEALAQLVEVDAMHVQLQLLFQGMKVLA